MTPPAPLSFPSSPHPDGSSQATRTALSDALGEVRAFARSTYWALNRHFPSRTAKMLATLDPSTHRLVVEEQRHYAARALDGGHTPTASHRGSTTGRVGMGKPSARPVAAPLAPERQSAPEREKAPSERGTVKEAGSGSFGRRMVSESDQSHSSRPMADGGGAAPARRVGAGVSGARRVAVDSGKGSEVGSQRDSHQWDGEAVAPDRNDSHYESQPRSPLHPAQQWSAREDGRGSGAIRPPEADSGVGGEMASVERRSPPPSLSITAVVRCA